MLLFSGHTDDESDPNSVKAKVQFEDEEKGTRNDQHIVSNEINNCCSILLC